MTTTRHRAVLTLTSPVAPDAASFIGDAGDGSVAPDEYALDRATWVDMGEPDTITITVEPGDLLADE